MWAYLWPMVRASGLADGCALLDGFNSKMVLVCLQLGNCLQVCVYVWNKGFKTRGLVEAYVPGYCRSMWNPSILNCTAVVPIAGLNNIWTFQPLKTITLCNTSGIATV
jgi:hypothetical protein